MDKFLYDNPEDTRNIAYKLEVQMKEADKADCFKAKSFLSKDISKSVKASSRVNIFLVPTF